MENADGASEPFLRCLSVISSRGCVFKNGPSVFPLSRIAGGTVAPFGEAKKLAAVHEQPKYGQSMTTGQK